MFVLTFLLFVVLWLLLCLVVLLVGLVLTCLRLLLLLLLILLQLIFILSSLLLSLSLRGRPGKGAGACQEANLATRAVSEAWSLRQEFLGGFLITHPFLP